MKLYSPINFRRLDWFKYEPATDSWCDAKKLNDEQKSLTLQSYRGYLKETP